MKRAGRGDLLKWLLQAIEHEGDECLHWPFGKFSTGYGQIRYEGRGQNASHVIALLVYGPPLPPANFAAHSCRNRDCCNKRHLSWKTHVKNQEDRHRDGTTNLGKSFMTNRNTSGVIGVGMFKRNNKWRAQITGDGKIIHLGSFDLKSDAIAARKAAEIQYGFRPNHHMEKP